MKPDGLSPDLWRAFFSDLSWRRAMFFFTRLIMPALLVLAGGAALGQPSGPYKLRHGDALMVSVWKDEALRSEVRVLPDGSITFPLAGRVEVVGLSTTEAEQRI